MENDFGRPDRTATQDRLEGHLLKTQQGSFCWPALLLAQPPAERGEAHAVLRRELALSQSAVSKTLNPLGALRQSSSMKFGTNQWLWFHALHSTTPMGLLAIARSPHGYEQEALARLQTEAAKNDYRTRLKLYEAKVPYRAKN